MDKLDKKDKDSSDDDAPGAGAANQSIKIS